MKDKTQQEMKEMRTYVDIVADDESFYFKVMVLTPKPSPKGPEDHKERESNEQE